MVRPNLDLSSENLISFFAKTWYIKNNDDNRLMIRIPIVAKLSCLLINRNRIKGKKI